MKHTWSFLSWHDGAEKMVGVICERESKRISHEEVKTTNGAEGGETYFFIIQIPQDIIRVHVLLLTRRVKLAVNSRHLRMRAKQNEDQTDEENSKQKKSIKERPKQGRFPKKVTQDRMQHALPHAKNTSQWAPVWWEYDAVWRKISIIESLVQTLGNTDTHTTHRYPFNPLLTTMDTE